MSIKINGKHSGARHVRLGGPQEYNGVKVFSATMVMDRERLGEKITDWIDAHPHCEVRDAVITQSSDEAFHCIAITLFYWETMDGESKRRRVESSRSRR